MKIVVFGAGGVGGYFGGKLSQAGNDVTFIARGRHLSAIQTKGLSIKSIKGDFHINPKAVDHVSELESPDLILLGIKSWQIPEVAEQIRAIVSKKTMVLPLQNGADIADKLRAVLGPESVLVGLCKIISRIIEPGVIDHFAYDPEIVFGEYNNERTDRIKKLKTVLEKAGIRSQISEDIHLDIWKKFLFITTISGIGALTRVPAGMIREEEHLREMLFQTAAEIVAVANAKGVKLNDDHIEMVIKVIDNLNYNATTSMQRDIMEGRPSELDVFNGYIVNEGNKLHVSTPVNNFIYHCLLPQEQKARKLS